MEGYKAVPVYTLKSFYIKMAIIVIVALICLLVVLEFATSVNKTNYNKIEIGMKISTVLTILGNEYSIAMSASVKGITIETYTWQNNYKTKTIAVCVVNGYVASKAQSGLY